MSSGLYKYLPAPLRKLSQPYAIRKTLHRKNQEIAANYVELGQENVNNIRILLDRNELLGQLPKGGVVAEIGVDNGDFSTEILKLSQPEKLHLVDVWSSPRYPEAKFKAVNERFSALRSSGVIQINRGYSTDVLPSFPDAYFDWVYLDSGHGFALTLDELVVEAVNKFCVEYKYEMIFLTMETHRHLSFAIRRLGLTP